MKRNDRDSPLKFKRNHSRYDDSPRDRNSPERRRGLNKSPSDRGRGRMRDSSDRILSRSMYDEYPRKTRSLFPKVLCATNFSNKISDNTIKDALQREYERFGDPNVKVIYDSNERVAYIYFRTGEDARDAYRVKNRVMIGEKAAHVEPALDRPSRRNRSFSPEFMSLRGLSPTHSSTSTNSFNRRGRQNSMERNGPFRDSLRRDFRDFQGIRRDESKKEKFPNYLHHVPPEQDDKATRTLFIGNLEVTILESELRHIFERYGIVEDVDVKRPAPGQGNAYAFIKYLNLDMAHRAKVEMSGQYIGKFQCKIGYGKATPTTRIWVGGLGPWTSLAHLEREFDRFGAIRKIDFVKGENHAYIQYDSIDAAQAACQEMRGFPLGGQDRRLRVDFADPGPYSYYQSPSRTFRDEGEQYASPPIRRVPSEDFYWQRPDYVASRTMDTLYDQLPIITDQWPEQRPSYPPDGRGWGKSMKNYWNNDEHGSMRNENERRKRQRSPNNEQPIRRDDGYKHPRLVDSPEPGEKDKSPNIRENNIRKFNKEASKANKPRNLDAKTKSNGNETNKDSSDIVAENVTNIQDLSKCCALIWNGCIILKNSAFPCKMHLCLGDMLLIDSLMKEPGVAVPTLRITQRLKLDKSKLDEVMHRIEKAGSQNHCLMLTVSGAQQTLEDPSIQQRPLRNLVSYLKQKEAAGVISLPCSKKEVNNKDQAGVLYAFPPCPFSINLLRRTAPNLNSNNLKDDHLIIVVVKGAA